MEEIQSIKKLLQEVSAISKKYEEIAKITGENFNIFKVMNMQSDEVNLHSAFLAELLNPKGTHGQGDVFLKLFVEQFGVKDFETENATAEAEKYIGRKTETGGGRIDIVVNSGNRNIFIENKIYAEDQPQQLLRYHNEDKNAYLFYLTLYGTDASENSTGTENVDYYLPISYNNDILKWLKLCKKETVNFPVLRETITQYINIIKYLTGQTMNEKMENEISQLIKAGYKSAKLIANNITKTERNIIYETIKLIYKKLQSELNDKNWDITLDDLDKDWSGISVGNKKWNRYIRVKLEGQPKIYSNKNSVFGIIGNKNEIDRNKYKKLLTDLINDYYLKKNSEGWIAYREISIFRDSIELFFEENKRKEIIDNYVKDFVNLSNSINDIIVNQDV